MESAILMEWMVKEGDKVTKGQVIAEVETSKGVIEIEVFEDGIVEKLLVEPETECEVGTPLAIIKSESKETIDVKEEVASKEEILEKVETTSPVEEIATINVKVPEPTMQERIKISPAARKKAQESGVDINVLASKTDGAIHLRDLEDATKEKKATVAQTEDENSVTSTQNISKQYKINQANTNQANINQNGMRKAIAAAMSLSNAEIPHYYLSTSINMTPALDWLEELNSKRSIKERILPAALLIRAIVEALKEVPELNGFYKDNSAQISEAINPGIAITLRKGGLITPALLNAQNMNLDETMQALGDLITRTRAGRLRGSEMTQQSVTITNLGDLGVERVYGVIYPPQVAIVGLGRIVNAPWAEGDTLAVRKVMQATLAGDHRATDGHTGALFLDKLDKLLQRPEGLL